jgi:hypothetical protein
LDIVKNACDNSAFLEPFRPFSSRFVKDLFRETARAALTAEEGDDSPDPIELLTRVRLEAEARLASPWSPDGNGGTQRELTIWALHRCAMHELLRALETDADRAWRYAWYVLDREIRTLASGGEFDARMKSLPVTKEEVNRLRAAGCENAPGNALELLQALDDLIAPKPAREDTKRMLGVRIGQELHTQLWAASLERGQTISNIVRETLSTSLQPQSEEAVSERVDRQPTHASSTPASLPTVSRRRSPSDALTQAKTWLTRLVPFGSFVD